MILTCPECATRYSVADDKVGPEGKAVRCASCSHRWMAYPDAEVELIAEVVAPDTPPVAASAPEPEPQSAAAPAAAKTANAVPKFFREKTEAQKTVREAVVNGVVWAVLGTCCLLLVAAGIVFRVDVVRVLPRTASAYAAVGLPVNPTGLVFEEVSAAPALQDGHAALVVSGTIRNIEKHAVTAPPIHISVLDKAGKAILARIADGPAGGIAPGQSHHFVVAVLDPPAAADDVEVTFAAGHKQKKGKDGHGGKKGGHEEHPAAHPEAGHEPAQADLHGSVASEPPPIPTSPTPIMEAMEAKPLPHGSPYALHAPPHG